MWSATALALLALVEEVGASLAAATPSGMMGLVEGHHLPALRAYRALANQPLA